MRSKYNKDVNSFKVEVTVCTLEDYMCETDFTEQDVQETWGKVYTHYVRAVVSDFYYGMRLFQPIKTKNGVTAATRIVLNELFKDYDA